MYKIKKCSLSLIALMLIVLSVFSCFADTIYEYYGLKYTLVNNFSVSVYGRTDTSPELSIPDKIEDRYITEIRSRAFMGDTNLESINLSKAKHLEYIGSFAFKDCSNLNSSLTIPNTVTKIETAAFENCKKLKSVTFKSTTDSISSQCFNGCTALSSVVLNNYYENIESYAFADCPNLKYIELYRNVKSIAKSAFKNDNNLTIGCYTDSYAYNYAKEREIKYKIIDPEQGDSNCDGSFNISDATAIQKYKAGLSELTSYGLKAADVNGDGSVTVRDATLIQMRIAGIIDEF